MLQRGKFSFCCTYISYLRIIYILFDQCRGKKEQTYYEKLGVEKSASLRDIKKSYLFLILPTFSFFPSACWITILNLATSYFKLAVEYHPDKAADKEAAEKKFIDITQGT